MVKRIVQEYPNIGYRTVSSMMMAEGHRVQEGCRTTRPKDNSPQDNSPHQNLAPRQLAPHSEDNSPQIRGQLDPHRRQLGPLLLLKKIKDKGVKLLNIFYQTYIFVLKCLYIYILMIKIFFLFLRF